MLGIAETFLATNVILIAGIAASSVLPDRELSADGFPFRALQEGPPFE